MATHSCHLQLVFLPEKSHGQWSLSGCSLLDCKESNTTEHTLEIQQEEIKTPIKTDDLNIHHTEDTQMATKSENIPITMSFSESILTLGTFAIKHQ